MAKLSKRLRYEILRRDGFKCRYCGAEPGDRVLQIDHVVPEALGGKNEPANLVTACEPCNSGKTSTTPDAPLVDEVAEGALRWSGAMQAAAAAMEKRIRDRRDKNAFFAEIWNGYKLDRGGNVPLPADWQGAVTRLESAGLTYLLFEEAVEVAMKAQKVLPENRFRYFCGVAWNMVTQLQEAAQQIASDPAPEHEDEDGRMYPELPEDELEAMLSLYEGTIEKLLTRLPVWLHEGAERGAHDDFHKAGELDATRIQVLPHVIRHLGYVLPTCDIQPGQEG